MKPQQMSHRLQHNEVNMVQTSAGLLTILDAAQTVADRACSKVSCLSLTTDSSSQCLCLQRGKGHSC